MGRDHGIPESADPRILTVNLDIVWEVVRQNLPQLDAAVRRMRSLDRPG